VANRHSNNILQQVAKFGKDAIVHSSCKVHHVISINTRIICIKIKSDIFLVWLFWLSSGQKFVSESSARACLCVCVCVKTVVQPPWRAQCKMTILKDNILFDIIEKFQIIDRNQSTLEKGLW